MLFKVIQKFQIAYKKEKKNKLSTARDSHIYLAQARENMIYIMSFYHIYLILVNTLYELFISIQSKKMQ